jgi:hypothetical protein
MRILVLLVLMSSSVAFAGHGDGVAPTRVSIGRPKGGAIDRVAVTARSHRGHLHVTLALDLSSRAKDLTEVALPLSLSSGTSVIGLTLGADEGKTLDATVARQRYDETVRLIRDPALLELTAPGRYALAVFPVSRVAGQTVKIELALPHGAPLLLDGVPSASLDLDGTPRRLSVARPVSLAAALEETRDEGMTPLAVDAELSLYAVPPQFDRSRPAPVPHLSGWHERERVTPTVSISERTRVKPFANDVAQPIKREIILYSSDQE